MSQVGDDGGSDAPQYMRREQLSEALRDLHPKELDGRAGP